MSLAPGTRLGPYEVIAPLGAGGMGEVYRARDTRLDRTVAVKVLPQAFSGDAALRQRLHTEARAISQLSHPHICTLHDIGEQDGAVFLVMELIEGETLAERLNKQAGRGLPLEEALRIGVQIVDALAAAHRRGIVHRDLKPGNVMLARAGSSSGARDAKLLDFGLAKVLQPAAALQGASTMPTTPPLAATAEGSLLGTFQYMSPEQVEGAEADARSDVFAAGCVLYEMLTGARPFDGRSPAATMAAILEREPVPLATRQPAIPLLVARIVERCLAKDADHRWQSAADLASALRLAGEAGAPVPVGQGAGSRPARARTAIGAGLIAAAALAGGAALAWRYATATVVPPAETRFEITPPPGVTWGPSPVASTVQLSLSPDGRRLAFVAAPRRGAPQIWIRSLDSVRAQPLAGTDDATFPFWSADGRFIGFFAGGKLKKVDIAGGTPQVLADAPLGRGGTWNHDDVILFVPSPNRGVWRIPAAGGAVKQVTAPTQVTAPDSATTNHVWPQFLADGRRFIYYNRSNDAERQGIYVRSLDPGEATQVVQNYGMAVATVGHLLLVREGTLFAQPVDDATMQPRGEIVRMADGVGYTLGGIGYSPLSAGGATLAYGPNVRLTTALRWRDRAGAAVGPEIARGVYRSPRLSADGRHVALAVQEERANAPDIFTLEIDRGVFTRVSTDPSVDWFPVWAAGGERVFFGSARTRATNLFERVLGADHEAPLAELTVARYPLDATGDGRLVYQEGGTDGYDLGMIALQGERKATTVLATPFNEVQARVSPNGRWMAYASDESGRFEVYVRGFPVGGQRTTISASGGMQPEWSRNGRELFYISSRRELMAVPVTTDGAAFSVGASRALFEVDVPEPTAPYPGDYAVSADGQRFLVNTLVEQGSAPSLTVVLNWAAGRRPE